MQLYVFDHYFLFHVVILLFGFELQDNVANIFYKEICSITQPLPYMSPSSLVWFTSFKSLIFQWKTQSFN